MTPRVQVREVRFRVLGMRTRMPFKYGIASLTALPHLFVEAEVDVDGRRARGLSSEGLPPKWFTKDASTTFETDLSDMLVAIRQAAVAATAVGEQPTAFAWWRAVHGLQMAWAQRRSVPPLLAGLGTSLVERALIDGVCRCLGTPFLKALATGTLGVRLPEVHPELPDVPVATLLPSRPPERVRVRHTVGLADPLADADLAPADRLDDGLPQTLEAAIRAYGLTHFKIKLSGDTERDLDRLLRIGELWLATGVLEPRWTLDGNEQFTDVAAFRRFWERFVAEPKLAGLREGLLLVEQPLHRNIALADATGAELRGWAGRPALIIDESDGEPDSLRRALESGYAGISHKNCKGVFRGIANACLIRVRQQRNPGTPLLLTSEDLATVGPVAMLQDLCVAACLGIDHSERNGHHYFRGLDMYDSEIQAAVLTAHPDLYRRVGSGGTSDFVALDVRGGSIATASVLAAPFGCGIALDPSRYVPLNAWSPALLKRPLAAGPGSADAGA